MAYKNPEDQRKAWREHYLRNKKYYAERNTRRRKELREWGASLKEGKSCSICGGFFHHKSLDWHHRDKSTKEFSIATAINNYFSKERILKEIEKCDLICSNCHRTI